MKLITKNEEETRKLAAYLGDQLEGGMTVLLEGQLGAGKTTFTKGLAESLGIRRAVKSPTYTLIKEYTDGRLPLYHMDLYRMEDAEDEDLGLEEYFFGQGVTVVEWGKFMQEDLPEDYLYVELKASEALTEREITVTAVGEKYKKIMERLEYDYK
ncbi:TsaE protein, required for threonylcarbamoyladenosine t(6)A37 formation in tRNA [Alkalibacterium sp. AK22]|uniref:tRNA (adenosine(37)-N6)-threonylcarbamoyltransferase complex ATPase subunit type 1 TsaE n=1 Tax=Alkalibacterium sp. AK22 TaxID=1229520 RepID=UPI00044702AE|nr:tRNA (adenosine(37)-N6)-threonylcarbamoyltransferase complex ATPase subunit type 1 TsaE [Alkalibacterium sp. AK22]EXJ23631.1 TsaE protein, required for threonylcarbamoyladenosine t(6)A37 formation in tRNA [Alkalibacterium sp. AK22]